VREQRNRLLELKNRDRHGTSSGAIAAPAKPAANVAARALAICTNEPVAASSVRQSVLLPTQSSPAMGDFIAAAVFGGWRKGYVFKRDALGTGYYRDYAAPVADVKDVESLVANSTAANAPDAAEGGDDVGVALQEGSLPKDFFDNPQEDPANKGRNVAATRKEQTLREEMADFQKLISGDLEASAAADAEDLEDEAEAKEIGEAYTQVSLSQRLKRLREKVEDGTASANKSLHAHHALGDLGPTNNDAKDYGEADNANDGAEDDDEDEDEEDDGWATLDWRAKRL